MKTRLAVLVARLAGWLSRALGRGGGTTLPGLVLLRIHPSAVGELAASLEAGCVVISATNGKTTTARLIVDAAEAQGMRVAANPAGSNLLRGVATALLDVRDTDAELGVFEVDEAALPSAVAELTPTVVVLMNLFRDQLDRYGELEGIVDTWREMLSVLPENTLVVGNADDPAIVGLVEDLPRRVLFGVDDLRLGRGELAHAADTTRCRHCDRELTYDLVTIGHMGHWRCEGCGWTRPVPDVSARTVELGGLTGQALTVACEGTTLEVHVGLPGLHNSYNVTAALATAAALGLDPRTAAATMASTRAAFGRGEALQLEGRQVFLLLAKNPTGANENVRTLLLESGRLDVLIVLNDRTADGQDVSWIWDVDYEPLLPRLASLTLAGDRAHDLALRFVYAGFERNRITVVPDVAQAIDTAVSATPEGSRLYVLPTYTAMLEVRAVLVERGVAQPFWEES